jgi:nitrous oxidase accessory protein NosD
VGPSTQARIRENELLGSSGGVSIGGGGVTGARVLVNEIGGRGLSDPKRSTAIGVEVVDGAHVVVAYNRISSQSVGLLLRTPVLQEGNYFELNRQNVVGP